MRLAGATPNCPNKKIHTMRDASYHNALISSVVPFFFINSSNIRNLMTLAKSSSLSPSPRSDVSRQYFLSFSLKFIVVACLSLQFLFSLIHILAASKTFSNASNFPMAAQSESCDRELIEERPWRVLNENKRLRVTVKQGNERFPAETIRNESDDEADRDDSQTMKSKKPLNILLLYGDDWRHDSLGAASNGLVRTPFLDNLAAEGIRFTHNCVTTSVCWISRATLYTGQYVSRHKSTEPMKPEFYKHWDKTFPYLLREAGYYFGHIGKWHFKDTEDFVQPRLDWQRFYFGSHWYPTPEGEIHSTKMNERDAIQFLQDRPKDKPFCLTVCFFTPHAEDDDPRQYLVQNESLSLYINATIPSAPSATEDAWKRMPYFFIDINEGRSRFFWRFDSPDKYQTMMKNYYRLISEIDSTSERIVKELEDQGILDETLVIFTTDNGYFHAEHGLADKFYPYQESIRVPLIIRDPRMHKEKIGTIDDHFTLNIDLAPTILAAAGLPTPVVMQGRDMATLYSGKELRRPWREDFFYEHPVHLRDDIIPASEALVQKDYKYVFWPNYDVEELFDLRNDKYELQNLINRTSYKDLLHRMRNRFNKLKVRAL
jgi:arylsulfatase A-like enzyme